MEITDIQGNKLIVDDNSIIDNSPYVPKKLPVTGKILFSNGDEYIGDILYIKKSEHVEKYQDEYFRPNGYGEYIFKNHKQYKKIQGYFYIDKHDIDEKFF